MAGNSRTPIIIALVLACVAMTLLSDNFLSSRNLTNILTQSTVVGIAAVGATLVIITGGIDLSVGSNVALSGMIASQLVNGGTAGFLGVVVCLVVAAGIGAFNGFSVAWLRLAPFIVTLAVLGMARGLTLQLSQGQSVYGLPSGLTWLGGGTVGAVPVPVFLFAAMFLVGHLVLSRTTLGHQIYAVGGNRQAARLSGIPDKRVLFYAYLIGGACAGLAALVLVGRLGAAIPTAGNGLELQVIAAVVIGGTSLFGGKGTMVGTLIGVLLIGVINNGLTLLNVSPFWVQFIQGALILAAVLLDAFNQRRLSVADA
ncbi:ABC transporter permease [Amycolatopsis rhabdoformis]|uniref:ABC transporter permease n=1 Tax=Amycolatopsis rhabdoformis TaxID=1448059 RepID=A0ABZ1IHK2_9PSEU|nr:ABC transporter permease [Amycolatopsis rhabdoformis]WSE33609.1 ABC transporter permease [Amycolatopsis rhabdoformis]